MFSISAIETLGDSVYALFDPENVQWPFYVGKGVGNRVFSHAESVDVTLADDDVMSLKEETIAAIKRRGASVVHKIIRFGMTHEEALKVEASLIDMINLIKPGQLTNAVSGQGVAQGIFETELLKVSLNAEKLETDLPVMVIKIENKWRDLLENNGNSVAAISHAQIFDAVRGDWRVNVARASATRCVLVVARGLVRDVVVHAGWEPSPIEGKSQMSGERDASAYRHLVGKSVAHLYVRGSQSAVRYLNDRPVAGSLIEQGTQADDA